ncbi:MAG: GNAT family N-acetyltransferase [Chloroflexi bacterium]|nr:GNAT family N-acetyltransferase [Chloroflexota bacterium]
MPIQINEINPALLDEYSRIPIRFEVKSIFAVELVDGGLGGILLHEKNVTPYSNDYDAHGKTPSDWPHLFDVKNWGFFLAHDGNENVGAAAIAFNTNGVHMLEERSDLAVLWDIRVRPEVRGRGVGKKLFEHAANWSRQGGCHQMKIETQNVNVAACRFYRRMGCELGNIHRFGYAAIPAVSDEVMLNWYFNL